MHQHDYYIFRLSRIPSKNVVTRCKIKDPPKTAPYHLATYNKAIYVGSTGETIQGRNQEVNVYLAF